MDTNPTTTPPTANKSGMIKSLPPFTVPRIETAIALQLCVNDFVE